MTFLMFPEYTIGCEWMSPCSLFRHWCNRSTTDLRRFRWRKSISQRPGNGNTRSPVSVGSDKRRWVLVDTLVFDFSAWKWSNPFQGLKIWFSYFKCVSKVGIMFPFGKFQSLIGLDFLQLLVPLFWPIIPGLSHFLCFCGTGTHDKLHILRDSGRRLETLPTKGLSLFRGDWVLVTAGDVTFLIIQSISVAWFRSSLFFHAASPFDLFLFLLFLFIPREKFRRAEVSWDTTAYENSGLSFRLL